jgi:hypothetical protein
VSVRPIAHAQRATSLHCTASSLPQSYLPQCTATPLLQCAEAPSLPQGTDSCLHGQVRAVAQAAHEISEAKTRDRQVGTIAGTSSMLWPPCTAAAAVATTVQCSLRSSLGWQGLGGGLC